MISRALGVAALCSLLALHGCGGGGAGPLAAAPGTGGTGSYTVGPISGFGSIIVNGVRYDDSLAVVQTEEGETSDDDKGVLDSADLRLGMITEVEGGTVTLSGNSALGSATASTIRLTHELRGPVTQLDATQGTLTVLQQTVMVTPATVLANVSSLASATRVNCAYAEVFAFHDARNGRYVATLVECRAVQPGSYRIFGPASAVTASGFNIHGLTISKGDAGLSGITDGTLVRAVLRPTLTGVGLNVATATRLSSNALGSQASSTDARLEGLISRFTSVRAFSVNGIEVVTTDSTAFEGARACRWGYAWKWMAG